MPVAKSSAEKATLGGRKAAFRRLAHGTAIEELIVVSSGFTAVEVAADHPDARSLLVPLVIEGEIDASAEGPEGVARARAHHAAARAELPLEGLALSRAEPAIPTVYRDAR